MTRAEIEKDIFETVKADYEAFVKNLKANGNYDFFKTLDSFAQRMAFLKSMDSQGINWYRERVNYAIFGCYRISKSFTFKNYENAVKSGYYDPGVDIDRFIKSNPILDFADDKTREMILGKTIFQNFKNVVEAEVKRTVSNAITTVMFGMRW